MSKQKLLVRIICIVLAVALVGSVLLVAVSSFSSSAAQISDETEVGASPAAGEQGYVNDDYVNLRSGAGTNYSVVTCMRKNTKFTFVDGKVYNSSWYKIRLTSTSQTGYIKKDYASVSSTGTSTSTSSSSSTAKTGYINDDYVNLRSGAGTSYSVVTCMRKNTKFTLVEDKLYNSSWYKIKLTSTSQTGYVLKDYVTFDSTASTTKLSINCSSLSLGLGESYNLTVTVSPAGADSVSSWSSSNTSVVSVKSGGTNKGTITGKATGTATITAKTKGGKSITSKVTVKKAPSSVSLNKTSLTLYVGDTFDLNSSLPSGTASRVVKYSSDKPSVATVKEGGGLVTAKAVGTAKITATTFNGKTATCTVTVKQSTGSVKLSETSASVYKGNYYVLYATASDKVSWSSSNTSVASVNSSGVVTAKANGTAIITAKCGTAKATCKITVTTGSSVKISSTSATLRNGKSIRLTSGTSGVKWKSSNTAIATVKNGVVDSKSKGYAVITAYTSSGAATCLVNVAARDNVRFCYASPNSAPLNSTVSFKAITDTDRVALRFVVSNGSTSYTVNASNKVKDGNTYIWTGSKKLTKSGKWTVKAYAKYKTSNDYLTTPVNGQGEVFVTTSTDTTTTVCSERRASDDIINLIANYEGFLTSVTADSITGDPTLGYGKVVTSNEIFYNNLTKNEAYAYLCQTVNSGGYTTKTNSFLTDNKIKFNQRQFDALVCFAYNVGSSAIANDSELQSVLLNTTGGSTAIKAGASGYVNASDVNLRSGAGMSYSVVTCMAKNTKFTFVDGKLYNSDWYKIKLSNGTTGYIYKPYASMSSAGTRDLNNVNKQDFLDAFLQYHHAGGSCYWGLMYRRIDEAEVFFYGDYARDGEKNKKGFKFTCGVNSSFKIS